MINAILENHWQNWLSPIWESFIEFIKEYTNIQEADTEEITHACLKVEKDPYKDRKTKERYIVHLYETTELFITLFWRDISKKRILACLLHDGIEDIHGDTVDSISEIYWKEVAFFIHILSKSDELNGKNRNNEYNSRFLSEKTLIKYIQDEYYFLYETDINLETAKKTAKIIIMIKACDRIHNLSTMPLEYFKQEKVRSKINETIKYYIPIIIEIFWKDSSIFKELMRALFFVENRLIISSVKNSL